MWGSDWPVCNMVGGKEAFGLWERVTERLLNEAGVSECDQEGFWWRTRREYTRSRQMTGNPVAYEGSVFHGP
jgi:hypothetical protein